MQKMCFQKCKGKQMRILRAADPDPDIRDFLLEFISSDRSSYNDDVLLYMDIWQLF